MGRIRDMLMRPRGRPRELAVRHMTSVLFEQKDFLRFKKVLADKNKLMGETLRELAMAYTKANEGQVSLDSIPNTSSLDTKYSYEEWDKMNPDEKLKIWKQAKNILVEIEASERRVEKKKRLEGMKA